MFTILLPNILWWIQVMSSKAMPTLKRGQNSFDGGCSTFPMNNLVKYKNAISKIHRYPLKG